MWVLSLTVTAGVTNKKYRIIQKPYFHGIWSYYQTNPILVGLLHENGELCLSLAICHCNPCLLWQSNWFGMNVWQDLEMCWTHWGRVTHICVNKQTIIVSDNGLSPGRRQAIIWNNVGLLLIEPLGTNSTEILIEIHTFSFKEMHLKLSSAKWRPCCLGLNVLTLLVSRAQNFQ